MSNIPETYEEYLKTPDDELIKISKSKKTFEEAKRLISFVNRAELEFKDKDNILSESNKDTKNQWDRYYGK